MVINYGDRGGRQSLIKRFNGFQRTLLRSIKRFNMTLYNNLINRMNEVVSDDASPEWNNLCSDDKIK